MRRIAILSAAVLLMTGVAVAGEDITQSEKSVQEKTTHSTTTLQENADQTGETRHNSTTVEKQHQTTTSNDMDGNAGTHKKVEVEKNRSKTTTESNDEGIPGSTQEYHQQSETHHQHTTDIEKN
jgi:hypothetical protein